jgi:hypothetical protein
MTLTAPKSRQGRLTLALAVLAALVALGGALAWYTVARADLPATTSTLSQSPPGNSTVNPGATVTYTLSATLNTALPVPTDELTLEITVDVNLVSPTVTCSPAANQAGTITPGKFFCNWNAPVSAGTRTATVTGSMPAVNLGAPSGKVCADTNANLSCDDQTGGDVQTATNAASVGSLTVASVTAAPASDTNLVGQSHTVTWTLPGGFTCAGDTNNNATVDCAPTAISFTAGGTGATVSAPAVTDADMADPSFVAVTISGATAAGTATVCLDPQVGDAATGNIDLIPVCASKTYGTLATLGGFLVHVDVDDASEDVAAPVVGDLDASRPAERGGVLRVQDDPDDATGSQHTVCLISGFLGAGDQGNIEWTILNTPGSQATAVGVTKVVLNIDSDTIDDAAANCVQWRSGGIGGQTILARYVPTNETVGYDPDFGDGSTGVGGPPLIKQWNDLDFTKIIGVTGNVGNTLEDNTLELDAWSQRDCTTAGFCARANLDGTTVQVSGTQFLTTGNILATGRSFIDYTFGDHADYFGPVDGALQNYAVSGDCGSVRLEDPVTGDVIILSPGQNDSVLSSDKGVGFQVLPTAGGALAVTPQTANCPHGGSVTVTITTREEQQLRSDLDTAPTERITVRFVGGPGLDKRPDLAWAGQRKVLEHDWSDPPVDLNADGDTTDPGEARPCPWEGTDGDGGFFVRYLIQAPSPGAITTVPGDPPAVVTGPDYVIVHVASGDDPRRANDDCISRVIYESQNVGQVDVTAHVVAPPFFFNGGITGNGFRGSDFTVISHEVDFLVYYMKFEDVTLGIVPGTRAGHNSGAFTPATPPASDPANDVESITSNVSADVLLRVKVRGWTLLPLGANCPARPQAEDSQGGVLPANRCIFPDDWRFLAGPLPEVTHPHLDVMRTAGPNTCGGPPAAGTEAGPMSLLDPAPAVVGVNPGCADSSAPLVTGGFRNTTLPDGVINAADAPMPPAEVHLLLTGSGFLKAADKEHIYGATARPFYVTHIPAEPWITVAGSNYRWNSWGVGPNSGLYDFWQVADHSLEVISCPGVSNPAAPGAVEDFNALTQPCIDPLTGLPAGGVHTGGYKNILVYTDNHGEAMAWANGDADLTFADCIAAGTDPVAALNLKEVVGGFFCQPDDVVGTSSIRALVNYPDKQGKHYPLLAGPVEITWVWGGEKGVQTVATGGGVFHYVIFSATDRDGFCNPSPSFHPVFGERVDFLIDSGDGTIIEGAAIGGQVVHIPAGTHFLTVYAFDSDSPPAGVPAAVLNAVGDDECIAYVRIVNTLMTPTNVLITAFDPEGVIRFDVILNPITPAPTPPPPTPTPAPPPPHLWGDTDCNGQVDSVDALGILRAVSGLPVNQVGPCFGIGNAITVNGQAGRFGDWDCDGQVTSVDALAVLRFVVGMPLTPSGCPAVGAGVTITG